MKNFSTIKEAIASIRGKFCLGCRMFQQPNNTSTTIWITCGIPGTGKSTIAKLLHKAYSPLYSKIISRDVIRSELIQEVNQITDEEVRKQQLKIMDDFVSSLVIKQIHRLVCNTKKEDRCAAIIIDGCHTDYMTLLELLLTLNQLQDQVLINLLVVGDEDSICCTSVNHKKEGDYSDYGPNGLHKAVPKIIIDRKRKEFHELIRHRSKDIFKLIDGLFCVPDAFNRLHYVK